MTHAHQGPLRKRVLATSGFVLALSGLGGGLFSSPAIAGGGGGCAQPAIDARGSSVEVSEFCFVPTVLRAEAGQAITWTNRDEAPHVVAGANVAWGSFEQFPRGQSVTYRFARTGVYPYVCSLHPGMVGAVVVGDGNSPGAAAGTDPGIGVTRLRAVPPAGLAGDMIQAKGQQEEASLGVWGIATLAVLGILVLAFWSMLFGLSARRAGLARLRLSPPRPEER